jgi:hypothetical protein
MSDKKKKAPTGLDLNNYHYKFMSKRSNIKNKDDFIEFYSENSMILHMVEYCETINQASMKSKVLNIDTAIDFFSFVSVYYE